MPENRGAVAEHHFFLKVLSSVILGDFIHLVKRQKANTTIMHPKIAKIDLTSMTNLHLSIILNGLHFYGGCTLLVPVK